jgi:hypothetical protein
MNPEILLIIKLLFLIILPSFFLFLGLGIGVNRLESFFARRQYGELAKRYGALVEGEQPLFGSAMLFISARIGSRPLRVESLQGGTSYVSMNGVMTPVRSLMTRVSLGAEERFFGWYMTSARKRRKVEAAIEELLKK